MICPKCDNGTLKKIQFKTNETAAYLCDVCDAFWFETEDITIFTGHSLQSFRDQEDKEYTFVEQDEKDQEHRAIIT